MFIHTTIWLWSLPPEFDMMIYNFFHISSPPWRVVITGDNGTIQIIHHCKIYTTVDCTFIRSTYPLPCIRLWRPTNCLSVCRMSCGFLHHGRWCQRSDLCTRKLFDVRPMFNCVTDYHYLYYSRSTDCRNVKQRISGGRRRWWKQRRKRANKKESNWSKERGEKKRDWRKERRKYRRQESRKKNKKARKDTRKKEPKGISKIWEMRKSEQWKKRGKYEGKKKARKLRM